MLCQLKTVSLLLNVKGNISQEQQSDEIKTEQGIPEPGWMKRGVLFCRFLFLVLLTVLRGAEGFVLCILCVHTLILQQGGLGRRRHRV